ncbi:Putative phosphinothricin acetyltransferase YwnH [Marinomonas gallaica]|uniref:Phosphinothricin acetyltransferase YwnH n=1 Tax=Marinomonas gallaica TaxID=1806667 RepID=A0A1C3JQB9_9GAMM|nr:GNAT family N-acetyltransferase [Marinomonas gallaica]SBT17418.1 Putative phosphinothricin acetyltransferase YwnH [Marinomonas gallaica]SBT19610.1 Putative phosphinothricin acetyltransferase YwnH [Marinomonas gallaica]
MNDLAKTARPATLDDAPSILSIFLESVKQTDVKGGINLLSVIDWIDNASDQYPLWVLEKDDSVIAWCGLEAFYGLPELGGVAEVAIYITARYQRQGLGAELLTLMERHGVDHNRHSLVAYILSDNHSSLQFFLRNSFIEWGTLPSVVRSGGAVSDLKLLGRQLDDVSSETK